MVTSGDREKDTICAISTPAGHGGISVIRISGESALGLTQKLCPFVPKNPESHKVFYGLLKKLFDHTDIDDVLVTYFQKGKSYTGEETIEVSCHGNPLITQLIMKEYIALGARTADRGEFTFRSFMNGRIDLTQAESVLSLIQGQSEQTIRQSVRQLKGQLSDELYKIEDGLIWSLAHIEASIDFSEEKLEVVSEDVLLAKMKDTESSIHRLLASYKTGRVIKDGFQVVIMGLPNVGKSSLLNLLAQEDRAIVTDIPGTTRDTLEVSQFIDGYKVNFVDTAGLRETSDKVEKLGIERSYRAAKEADLVLFVYDSNKALSEAEIVELKKMDQSIPVLFVANKSDLNQLGESEVRESLKGNEFFTGSVILFSCRNPINGSKIRHFVSRLLESLKVEDQTVVIQARHFENLQRAEKNLQASQKILQETQALELVALELKEGLLAIQEILGKRFDDDVMDRVFKEFCIGK